MVSFTMVVVVEVMAAQWQRQRWQWTTIGGKSSQQ
jgi:hypothetical protein